MADLTLMSLRAMAETAASVGIGVSVVGGGLIWLLREKIAKWVRSVMDPKVRAIDAALEKIEKRMGKVEGEVSDTETAVKLIAKSIEGIGESFRRATEALQRVDERSEETALTVARIEGTMERRAERPPK